MDRRMKKMILEGLTKHFEEYAEEDFPAGGEAMAAKMIWRKYKHYIKTGEGQGGLRISQKSMDLIEKILRKEV